MFSIIVVIILGLAIGLPLGLLLNKSSSSQKPPQPTPQPSVQEQSGTPQITTMLGWYDTKTNIITDLTNPSVTNIADFADLNMDLSWGYDANNPNFDTRNIPELTYEITVMLKSLKPTTTNNSYYGVNFVKNNTTGEILYKYGQF